MGILLIASVWIISGVFGSYLTLEFGFRRHRSWPLDINVGDILAGSFAAIFGPLNILVGTFFFAEWLLGSSVMTDRVVFRRHNARPRAALSQEGE